MAIRKKSPLKKIFKFIFGLLLLITLVLIIFIIWAPGQLPEPGLRSDQIAEYGVSSQSDSVSSIRVMVYNIGYGYGSGSDGSDYKPKAKEETDHSIEEIAELIRNESIDLVLIQEIDFGSDRSGGTNQLQLLAERSGLTYTARAMSWDANYVPFPYWPIDYHFGRVQSGGAVLSRFPIVENDVKLLAKPAANPWWYNRFYLYRIHQSVGFIVNGDTLYAVNNHLESFNVENRMEHAQSLLAWVEELSTDKNVIVVGGDMNAVPPNAQQTKNFDDLSGDDYTGDQTMTILSRMGRFQEIATAEQYAANPSAWHTFPAENPNRRLDYIFVNQNYTFGNGRVLQAAGTLSDHLPVIVDIQVIRN